MTTPPPTCLDCNYALTGVPTPRCPECGRDFDPADPATVGPREPLLLRIARQITSRYPSARVLLIVTAALVVCIVVVSPTWNSRGWGALATMAIIMTLLFAVLLTSLASQYLRRKRGVPESTVAARWFILLGLFWGAFVCIDGNKSLRFRAWLSKSAIVRHATALETSQTPPPARIGLFRVKGATFDAASADIVFEVEPILMVAPPRMAIVRGSRTPFGNASLPVTDAWRLEWDGK